MLLSIAKSTALPPRTRSFLLLWWAPCGHTAAARSRLTPTIPDQFRALPSESWAAAFYQPTYLWLIIPACPEPWLFPASSRGRTVILTQDFSPTKIVIANTAQHFLPARPCPEHFKCVNAFRLLGQVKAEGQDSFQNPSWLLT